MPKFAAAMSPVCYRATTALSSQSPIDYLWENSGGETVAVLCLDYDLEETGGCDLQDWLGGQWALLFSHPRDFQYLGPKQQRWLDALRQDSHACAVRPIALKRSGGPLEASWVDELLGERQLIRLRDPPSDATAQ